VGDNFNRRSTLSILQHILKKIKGDKNKIYIVSGLPRSGTSMMMKMIETGGITPFIDNIRIPDEDNPRGYYEFERVKQLAKDNSWLREAQGKVVKVISMLLQHLPPSYEYKVIFMHRNMDEVLASQEAMLLRKGKKSSDISDEELAATFTRHLKNIEAWLKQQSNIKVLYINYNELLKNPHENVIKINNFMNHRLNDVKMLKIIDPDLYRQRREL